MDFAEGSRRVWLSPQQDCPTEVLELVVGVRASVVGLRVQACPLERWIDSSADFQRVVIGATSAVFDLTEDHELVGIVMPSSDGHRGWVAFLATGELRRPQGRGRTPEAAADERLRVDEYLTNADETSLDVIDER